MKIIGDYAEINDLLGPLVPGNSITVGQRPYHIIWFEILPIIWPPIVELQVEAG